MKILITGGAGFIGSHLADYFSCLGNEVIILDNMGYASNFNNIKNLIDNKKVSFILGDISNYAIYNKILPNTDLVIHTAAESHVDNSFFDPWRFVQSNVTGTQVLLQACLDFRVPKVLHFSTDEVYGDIVEGEFYENSPLNPTNPYSASKAAADMIVNSYKKSFKMNILTVRPNNIYGTRQHWEKLIPTCILHLKKRLPIPIHGTGNQKRKFLSVKDLCNAIELVVTKGKDQEIYNIGCDNEYSVLEVVELITRVFNDKSLWNFVEDRQYNDVRYSINYDKIKNLGFYPQHRLEDDLEEIFNWYWEQEAPFAHGWFKNV